MYLSHCYATNWLCIGAVCPCRYIVLTTSSGILDHEEARRKHTGGKIIGFFYWYHKWTLFFCHVIWVFMCIIIGNLICYLSVRNNYWSWLHVLVDKVENCSVISSLDLSSIGQCSNNLTYMHEVMYTRLVSTRSWGDQINFPYQSHKSKCYIATNHHETNINSYVS